MAARAGLYGLLVGAGLLVLLPYVWMVSTSLKPEDQLFVVGVDLIPRPVRWQNYVEVWTQHPIGRWLASSVLVATIETSSTLATALLAGFAFARLRFWGRDGLFLLYLGAMMVPGQITLIPSFVLVRSLGLASSYAGVVAPHLVQFFGVFLMRQFLLNIPSELEEAARIDGCKGWWRVLWRIVVPISLPAIAALTVFSFTASWNNFLWPLVVINKPEIMTVQVGLAGLRGGTTPWGQLMAATAMSALPLTALYVPLQRYFTQGVVMSGVKG